MGRRGLLVIRQCAFCKRFWRAVFSYALPVALLLVWVVGLVGLLSVYYWAFLR